MGFSRNAESGSSSRGGARPPVEGRIPAIDIRHGAGAEGGGGQPVEERGLL